MKPNNLVYKEYNYLNEPAANLGMKIESSIIPLTGRLLDYIEVMLKSFDIPEQKYQAAYKAIRSKILRDGNDTFRALLKEIRKYDIKSVSEDIIEFNH